MIVGLKAGPVGGVCVGVTADDAQSQGLNPMAGVTVDAASGKYLPASAAEWTKTMSVAGLATGNPSALWLLQEASGNPADSIGAFPLTASGTGLGYDQAVSGWATKALTTTDGSTGKFLTAAAGLPDISAASCLVLAYVNLPASASATERSIVTLGPTFQLQAGLDTFPSSNPTKIGLSLQGGSQGGGTTTAAATATTGVHPVVLQWSHATLSAFVSSDKDKITGMFSVTGKTICFGGDNGQFYFGGTVGYMYAAAFFSAAAELTSAQIKTLLTTLGWSVGWT